MTGQILKIDGKEYTIKYTINILCEMTKAGIDVMNLDSIVFNMINLRSFFYYGLKSADKKITENKAGDIMDAYIQEGHEFNDIMEIIMSALAESLGSKEQDNEGDSEKN